MTAAVRKEHRLFKSPEALNARHAMSGALAEYRKKHNLTRGQLATRIGCSEMQIYHLEKKHNDPSHALFISICKVMGLSVPLT